MKLTAENVTNVLTDCLARETGELTPQQLSTIRKDHAAPDGWKIVDGIMRNFMFNEQRVDGHDEDIRTMLDELPEQFKVGQGGGWSFLNACMTADGRQWGEHPNVEELIVLGIAAGRSKFQLPKSMWDALPGGMPYFSVDTEFKPKEEVGA